jgi:hypothetical protein
MMILRKQGRRLSVTRPPVTPNFKGVILREGPSYLNGEPIATIAIFNSTNRKTGDMVQIYYLPVNEPPTEAVKTGADESICGDCTLRPLLAKEQNIKPCYVKKFHGPSAVFRSFKAGRYPHLDKMKPRLRQGVLQLLASKPVRLGAWGDPACDLDTIPMLTQHKWTGYTHQWKANPQLRNVLMASVDSIAEYHEAKKQGWRCYRHTSSGEMLDSELQCLFYTHDKTCKECGLCSGNNSKAKDIVTSTI